MTSVFNVVGIIGHIGRVKHPGMRETLSVLIEHLRRLNQSVIVDTDTANELDDSNLKHVPRNELGKHCNLLIVVGGDGSLLHATHLIINDDVPVLGVNRGRLGFLTDIHPTELDKIKAILAGNYLIEKRFLLSATVEYQGEILGKGDALNEIALVPDAIPHMHEFEIYIGNHFVCSQDSDGLIVATPTGSTAYALSGGGPIVHPQLDAMVLVPMYPHTLSLRPIVIDANARVTIIITPNNKVAPRLSCDSQTFIQTPPGSQITIEKKAKQLHLIHPTDYDYYESLRSKLHWGHKLQYTD